MPSQLSALPWSSIFLLVFTAAFLIVGCLRVVEFKDVGLTPLVRGVLMAIHLVGCLFFAAALAIFAVDIAQTQKTIMYSIFASGVLTLFPVHIYLALKRRQRAHELGLDL